MSRARSSRARRSPSARRERRPPRRPGAAARPGRVRVARILAVAVALHVEHRDRGLARPAARGRSRGAATSARAASAPPGRPRARIRGPRSRSPLNIPRAAPCGPRDRRRRRGRARPRATIAAIPATNCAISRRPGRSCCAATATTTARPQAMIIGRHGRMIGLRPRCDLKKTKTVGSAKAIDHRQRRALDARAAGSSSSERPTKSEHRARPRRR